MRAFSEILNTIKQLSYSNRRSFVMGIGVSVLQVLIIGHVPPGYTTPAAICQMTSHFNEDLVNVLLRHADVITAMHFGHEHHDNFRLLYNSSGKILRVFGVLQWHHWLVTFLPFVPI